MEKKSNGRGRYQTFKECAQCHNMFGPLDRLNRYFCSFDCRSKYQKTVPSNKKGKKYPHLQRARIGNCLICKKEFRAINDFKERKQKYCSVECFQKDWGERIVFNIPNPKGKVGEENYIWKGEFASYGAMHKWVARWKGKPMVCDHCGSKRKKKYEWSNKDHQYRRNLDDYQRLCTSCHRLYDISVGLL